MKLGTLTLFFCVFLALTGSYAFAEVSAGLYYADSNTPLEHSDIMVGTQLKMLIHSTESLGSLDSFYGVIVLEDANITKASLYAEEGTSILAAAGIYASIFSLMGTSPWSSNTIVEGYSMMIDCEASAGDWFIFDYNAIELGNCSVAFYDYPPLEVPTLLQTIQLNHVKTRDIDNSYAVGFGDFAYLAKYWQVADCGDDPNCHKVDFDDSNNIDFIDLMHFVDYWLEETR